VARFTAVVRTPAPAAATWQLLTDWPAHRRWIPLTDVRVLTPQARGLGARFNGRTGLGPLAFDDPMEIVEWREPGSGRPGLVRLEKQGRVVLGSADIEVEDTPGGGSVVRWTEDVQVVPVRLTRPFDRLVAALGRRAFERSLRAMASELAAGPR
jgi:carbon monoxide dehydrogenase subunit G